MVIDDPLKPDDAFSDTKRNAVNQRFDSTVKSRLNTDDTPIIVVMQRLHEDDYTGMLLEHSEFDFEHVVLPALQETDSGDVALWEYKHDLGKAALNAGCRALHVLRPISATSLANGRRYI